MQSLVRKLLLGGLAGKALGACREVVAAWCFGTGLVATAFRLSLSAFLLPLHGIVSDVTSGGFTPRYARLRLEDPKSAQQLFGALHSIFLSVSAAVAIVLLIATPPYVRLLAPGIDQATLEQSVVFVRIMCAALPAYVLVSLYCAVELVHGKGSLTSMRASWQSIGLLLGTLLAWAVGKPALIALGFVTAYVGLAFFGALSCRSLGLDLWLDPRRALAAIPLLVPVVRVMKILVWAPIVIQVAQVVERRVASNINPQAIAGIDYARFISETLLLLLAVPFAVAGQAAMPTMSQSEFEEQAKRSLLALAQLGLLCASFIFVHSQWIVSVLFQRGAFDEVSTAITSGMLSALSTGLPFALVAYAAQKFLNARGLNKAVVLTTLLGAAAGIALNLTCAKLLGPSVIGYATAVTAGVMCAGAVYCLGIGGPLGSGLKVWLITAASHCALLLVARRYFDLPIFAEVAAGASVWASLFVFSPAARKSLLDIYLIVGRKVAH
ncbi:hypothetical protein MW290_28530 [Aquincola tertiaricarbonis]|uniref:Virulence factor MviN n=1 Tax=Aquincola tertiaricarbonis TaxID=391953 RepID=A0ABY4SC76_AQUTE|nr:lipid II flippase MurJ [Aquincola tertiaricarbonis]URI09507.1 hypothetical protein MW290_28530 [Aquincola tertiaricarbonis]